MNAKYFSCRDCGAQVCWLTSQAGKRYIAEPWQWVGGDYSLHAKMIPAGHKCVPNPQWREQHEEAERAAIAAAQEAGEIRKGVIVEVVKGRKIPIGTRGEVFWSGEGSFGERVGIMADGEKIYIAATNVKAVSFKEEGAS
jgi:hypothetical protein